MSDRAPGDAQAAVMAAALCRFTAFTPLSEAGIADLMAMATGHREVKPGEFIVHEGDAPAGIHLLIAGWTASSIAFANGHRQLIKVHLPGDLLGLPSIALAEAVDSIVALTEAVIAQISHMALGQLFIRNPRLAALLFMISQEERVMLMDRLASIGSTPAASRLAALLLQIHARVVRARPETQDAFDFPLLQNDVADMIGVTAVHLNRTAQTLRAKGLLTWKRHRITIHDFPAMMRLADLPRRNLHRAPSWLPAEA